MTAAVDRAADAAEIRGLIDAWRRALRDRDADALLARCAPDMLVCGLAPPLQSRGADLQAEELRAWFATWNGPIDWRMHDLRLGIGGAVAFATGLARLRGTRTDGGETDMWSRVTIGFRRTEEGWRVAHHHESVPFHMDGGLRAAVDLRP